MFSFSTYWNSSRLSTAEYYATFWSRQWYHFEWMEDEKEEKAFFQGTPLKVSNIALRFPAESKEKIPCLTSEVDEERARAQRRLENAVEKALRCKTPYVLLWPGNLALLSSVSPEKDSLSSRLSLREALVPHALDRLCRALYEVGKKYPDVVFCLPAARYLHEIPFLPEFEWICQDLKGVRVAYWHKPTHTYLLEKAGLSVEEAWLERYGKYLIGVHFEDLVGDEMGFPAGSGEIYWKKIKPFLSEKTLRVLRVGSRFSLLEVEFAYQYLQEAGLL